MDSNEESVALIKSKFSATCNNCGSDQVYVDTYVNGDDGDGHVIVTMHCKTCNENVELFNDKDWGM